MPDAGVPLCAGEAFCGAGGGEANAWLAGAVNNTARQAARHFFRSEGLIVFSQFRFPPGWGQEEHYAARAEGGAVLPCEGAKVVSVMGPERRKLSAACAAVG